MWYRILLFAVINFSALAIGGYFTKDGVPSDWYTNLNKAPWTPPGWMFGAAWATIMICFAIYVAYASLRVNSKQLYIIFGIQWILNVIWNPIFFYFHQVGIGLIVISSLTLVVLTMLYFYRNVLGVKSLWLAPYVIWMFIATSLNAYILLKN